MTTIEQMYSREVVNKIYNDIYQSTIAKMELIGWYLIVSEGLTIPQVIPDGVGDQEFTNLVNKLSAYNDTIKSIDYNGYPEVVQNLILDGIATYLKGDDTNTSLNQFLYALNISRRKASIDKIIAKNPDKEFDYSLMSLLRVITLIDSGHYVLVAMKPEIEKRKQEKEKLIEEKKMDTADPVVYTYNRGNKAFHASSVAYCRDCLINGDRATDVAQTLEVSIPTLQRIVAAYERYFTLPSYQKDEKFIEVTHKNRSDHMKKIRKDREKKQQESTPASTIPNIKEEKIIVEVDENDIVTDYRKKGGKTNVKRIIVSDTEAVYKLAKKLGVEVKDILNIVNKKNRTYSATSKLPLELTKKVCDFYHVAIDKIVA